jgi:hypothetical protein
LPPFGRRIALRSFGFAQAFFSQSSHSCLDINIAAREKASGNRTAGLFLAAEQFARLAGGSLPSFQSD